MVRANPAAISELTRSSLDVHLVLDVGISILPLPLQTFTVRSCSSLHSPSDQSTWSPDHCSQQVLFYSAFRVPLFILDGIWHQVQMLFLQTAAHVLPLDYTIVRKVKLRCEQMNPCPDDINPSIGRSHRATHSTPSVLL